MGLLSNFRNRSNSPEEASDAEETSDAATAAVPEDIDSAPALDFDFGDTAADESDDQWLEGIERRKPDLTSPEPTSPEAANEAIPAVSEVELQPITEPELTSIVATQELHLTETPAALDSQEPGFLLDGPAPLPIHLETAAPETLLPMDGTPAFVTETPAPPAPQAAGDDTEFEFTPEEYAAALAYEEAMSQVAAQEETIQFSTAEEVNFEEPEVEAAPADLAEMRTNAIHDMQADEPESLVAHLRTAPPVDGPLMAPAEPTGLGIDVAPEPLPDLGMVYAGLSAEGISGSAAPVPPAELGRESLTHGPLGPQALPLLQSLGLQEGSSWQEVTATRRSLLATLPTDGTPEQIHRRIEVNHATASLRLLRVGPLHPA